MKNEKMTVINKFEVEGGAAVIYRFDNNTVAYFYGVADAKLNNDPMFTRNQVITETELTNAEPYMTVNTAKVPGDAYYVTDPTWENQ